MSKSIQLQAGQKFGRLTIISLHHISNIPKSREFYLCKCDCGNETVVEKWNLKTKHTTSCGCFAKDLKSKIKSIHGLSKHKIYGIWVGMKNRCYNKNEPVYYRYGGRDIIVCDEWKNDFMAFYNWSMANGYQEGLTIDRINNNGNYEPSNCRWITRKEQCRNRSTNKIFSYNGKSYCVMEWAKKIGIKYHTLLHRLNSGWEIERAFNCKK